MATILLVEDNRDLADMVALVLELEGHVVHTAYDGADGLREAARIKTQVAVLDIGLPKLDGVELAYALRQMHGSDVTLIACTGISDGLVGARVASAGFDHVFVKPVSIDTLLGAVTEACAREAARPPSARRASTSSAPPGNVRTERDAAHHAAP